tara:strand:- start:145 stop:501 length:357 start_codon:yes stop_codon:yes gene_type:complete
VSSYTVREERYLQGGLHYQPHQFKGESMTTVAAQHILIKDEDKVSELTGFITPENFTKMAEQHSTCNSAKRGGHLGFFGRGQMLPEFEQACFSAPLNEVVGPVKTQCGWHFILVNTRN